MYATNSATVSPSSTLDRQNLAASPEAETPVSQVVLTTQVGGPPDQSGYTIVSTEPAQPAQISPALSSDDSNRGDAQPPDDSFNPYSALAHNQQLITSPTTIVPELPTERKDRFELVDPSSKKLDWSYSLFACCNDKEGRKWLGLSCFCPCYVAGRVAEVAGDNGIACCLVECICPISCFFGALVRRKIRLQRNILGSSSGDMLATCCCRPCTLVQEAREQNLPMFQEVERA